MPWWLYFVLAIVAFVAWDFRRFSKKRAAEKKATLGPDSPAEEAARRTRPPARAAEVPLPIGKPAQEVPAALVTETSSVVLRRQMPPRDDARSWLGGLPRMPEGVAWPRSLSAEYPDRGERPLHFAAQICCEDLPADLWAGHGPRTGWLLLFLDPNQGTPEGPDAFHILYSEAPGEERAAPFDLGPVHDGQYGGGSYTHLPTAEIPNVWRRWPVDLVAVPNAMREEHGRSLVAPENLAAMLYDGAPVSDQRPNPPIPFTLRGALAALDSARSALATPIKPIVMPERLAALAVAPGYLMGVLARADAELEAWYAKIADFVEGPEPGEASERERWNRLNRRVLERHAERERLAEFIGEHASAEAVTAYLHEIGAEGRAWQDEARAHLDRLREAVQAHDLDSPLAPEDWADLTQAVAPLRLRQWTYDTVRDGDRIDLGFREIERKVTLEGSPAMHDLVADYYVDPARRDLIPADVLAVYEPWWRHLDSNRPHRMGGYHDGLQSDAVAGPTRDVLLFQLASDDAMEWCWGDAGAWYFYVRPAHLDRQDFSGVDSQMECH